MTIFIKYEKNEITYSHFTKHICNEYLRNFSIYFDSSELYKITVLNLHETLNPPLTERFNFQHRARKKSGRTRGQSKVSNRDI